MGSRTESEAESRKLKKEMNTEYEERATAEIERIERLLFDYNINERKIKMLSPVIENTAWMKVKLDDAREAIKNSNVVIPYDNGGGQTGIRENPLFKGYESLWKAYVTGMSKILESLPREAVVSASNELEQPKTLLQLVRNKHKKEA